MMIRWIFLCLPLMAFANTKIDYVHMKWVPDFFKYSEETPYEKLCDWHKIHYILKQHGITIQIINLDEMPYNLGAFYGPNGEKSDVKKVVFSNFDGGKDLRRVWSIPPEKLALIMWEPPSVMPYMYFSRFQNHFSRLLTWDDDLVDDQRFFKFYYAELQPMIEDIPPYEEKKLCCLVSRNLKSAYVNEVYSKRREAIEFFEQMPEDVFDLYGYGWETENYRNYQGSVDSKIGAIKNYLFSICYENTLERKGYITEKIFDCFRAGNVPVYLGASNITDYIPKECFVDKRDFPTNEALYYHLSNMTQVEHEQYIANIRLFLDSEAAQLFTRDNFVKIFLKAICDIDI